LDNKLVIDDSANGGQTKEIHIHRMDTEEGGQSRSTNSLGRSRSQESKSDSYIDDKQSKQSYITLRNKNIARADDFSKPKDDGDK